MAGDYIPHPDADFNSWLANFVTYANANLAGLGIVAADMNPVTGAQSKWNTDYPLHISAQANAQAARQLKDDDRAGVEAAVRPLVRRLQASAAVSDTEKAALGITVPGANPMPGGPPTGRPILKVECERLRHTLRWADVNSPTSRAKPPGVLGAEIKMAKTAIGAATPTDPALFDFIALDTATPYIQEFAGADGGKNAHYIARWVNLAQQHGPWSETVSVTVGV
jgi:hypothetical protein